jgi:hypothetical protein
MSRENPNVVATVIGNLTGVRNYQPHLTLRIVELWGTDTVPDDLMILGEELSAMSGLVVEEGDYILEYDFNGKRTRKPVRVVGERLTSRAA